MGSLPDLTERDRPARVRPASRTVSDPHRNRTTQIPISTICKKEWSWKKPMRGITQTPNARRRDSAASSLGAASVRHLIHRAPAGAPNAVVHRFALLCLASGLCATSILPFTALIGAGDGDGSLALTLMHTTAAIFAPFSQILLQKVGARVLVSAGHGLLCALLLAHAFEAPDSILWSLYSICGCALSPLSLTLSVSAMSLAQGAGDEGRRRMALRRGIRAIRGAQDLGLIVGSLLLGAALTMWPEEIQLTILPVGPQSLNSTSVWLPQEESLVDDDLEAPTCGAAGCPGTIVVGGNYLSVEGRRILLLVWSALAFAGVVLGACGAGSSPAPPPDTHSIMKDPRTLLGVPMGLFIGLQQGFIYTSYVKWYGVCVGGWTCAWRALCGAGLLQALAAATLSMAAARGRRGALAAGGGAAHASLMLALLRWRAARTDLALPAVAAAAWGACAALWDVLQAYACIGGSGWRGPWSATLAARHAGFAIACAARRLVCARVQLAVLAVTLVAALASHLTLELRQRRADKHRS